jgi:hypothetical protein
MVSGYGVIPRKFKPFFRQMLSDVCATVFVTGTFTPSIPLVAEDLNTTGAIVKSVASFAPGAEF